MHYRKLPQTTANAVPANADELPHLPHSSKRMRYAVSDDLEMGGRMIEKKIAAVRNYDWALRVTLAMDADDARLVWGCAHSAFRRVRGPAWSKVGRMRGMHADTVRRRFEGALLVLWYKLDYYANRVDEACEIAL
jgi:hypothetical protein